MPSLLSRTESLAQVVINYAKAGIEVLWCYQFFLNLLLSTKYFAQEWTYKQWQELNDIPFAPKSVTNFNSVKMVLNQWSQKSTTLTSENLWT